MADGRTRKRVRSTLTSFFNIFSTVQIPPVSLYLPFPLPVGFIPPSPCSALRFLRTASARFSPIDAMPERRTLECGGGRARNEACGDVRCVRMLVCARERRSAQ